MNDDDLTEEEKNVLRLFPVPDEPAPPPPSTWWTRNRWEVCYFVKRTTKRAVMLGLAAAVVALAWAQWEALRGTRDAAVAVERAVEGRCR